VAFQRPRRLAHPAAAPRNASHKRLCAVHRPTRRGTHLRPRRTWPRRNGAVARGALPERQGSAGRKQPALAGVCTSCLAPSLLPLFPRLYPPQLHGRRRRTPGRRHSRRDGLGASQEETLPSVLITHSPPALERCPEPCPAAPQPHHHRPLGPPQYEEVVGSGAQLQLLPLCGASLPGSGDAPADGPAAAQLPVHLQPAATATAQQALPWPAAGRPAVPGLDLSRLRRSSAAGPAFPNNLPSGTSSTRSAAAGPTAGGQRSPPAAAPAALDASQRELEAVMARPLHPGAPVADDRCYVHRAVGAQVCRQAAVGEGRRTDAG
jgi:hypothetical protein